MQICIRGPFWLKSDNFRLRYGQGRYSVTGYGDDAIFKMATVSHLEFSKIAILVTWPWPVCDSVFRSKFRINRSIWRRDIAKKIFNMASVRHLELAKFGIFDKYPWWELDVHLPTKFDRNRIILGLDMEIMLFSKWRPSAMLNLRQLQFWLCDILACDTSSLFQISRWSANMATRKKIGQKKRFSIWRPSAILDLLWRHCIASESCILRSQFCVKFSRRSVS